MQNKSFKIEWQNWADRFEPINVSRKNEWVKLEQQKHTAKIDRQIFIEWSCESGTYINVCHSVDRINCSLVTPENRQRQSDGYQWRLFGCCKDIVKMEETSNNSNVM